MKPLVIYHASCQDGLTAAWVMRNWLVPTHGEVECFAAHYAADGQRVELPEVHGRPVWMVDFCTGREQLLEIINNARSFVLLDHHRTAAAEIAMVQSQLDSRARVRLSNGESAWVDIEDLDKVTGMSWSKAVNGGAAVAYAGGGRAKPKLVYMHRVIMDAADGVLVDHINRNPLDNRKANLRLATKQQNAANMDRGTEWKGTRAKGERWVAQIVVNGENRYLGIYDAVELAARAYDNAARQHFGAFALLNFPDPVQLVRADADAEITFDMERSGAMLAWDYCHSTNEAPWLVQYAQDRDLWRWVLPRSREVNAFLACQDLTLEAWDRIATSGMSVAEAADRGRGALDYVDNYVRAQKPRARRGAFGGHADIPVINTTTAISELIGALAEDAVFAVGWFERDDGKLVYSLRSRGDFDVSAVAKQFGGGGHKNAAGFTSSVRVHE